MKRDEGRIRRRSREIKRDAEQIYEIFMASNFLQRPRKEVVRVMKVERENRSSLRCKYTKFQSETGASTFVEKNRP